MLEVELVSYVLQLSSGHFYRQSLGSVPYEYRFSYMIVVINTNILNFQNGSLHFKQFSQNVSFHTELIHFFLNFID